MSGATIHFTINGRCMVGVHTGTDYEEIEVTTADGEKYYLPDGYLDQATTAGEADAVGIAKGDEPKNPNPERETG